MKAEKIKSTDIKIRTMTSDDIAYIVDYWHNNTQEFWEERGVDKSKFKSATEMSNFFNLAIQKNGQINSICIIEFKGKPIGMHSVNELREGEDAVFHAHIWFPEFRGLGIAKYSYLRAAQFFFTVFKLKKILFKTPQINAPANQLKIKLGIPCIGKTVFDSPILLKPLDANLYELNPELLGRIVERLESDSG